jgi:trigger factor
LAKRRVSLSLILGKLIDAYGVKLDPNRVRTAVEELAASYEQPAEVVRWYYAEPSRLREIENMVFEDQIVDLIFEKAASADVSIPFQTLMAGAMTAPSATQPA